MYTIEKGLRGQRSVKGAHRGTKAIPRKSVTADTASQQELEHKTAAKVLNHYRYCSRTAGQLFKSLNSNLGTMNRGRQKSIPGMRKSILQVQWKQDQQTTCFVWRPTAARESRNRVGKNRACLPTRANAAVTAGASALEPNWAIGSLSCRK